MAHQLGLGDYGSASEDEAIEQQQPEDQVPTSSPTNNHEQPDAQARLSLTGAVARGEAADEHVALLATYSSAEPNGLETEDGRTDGGVLHPSRGLDVAPEPSGVTEGSAQAQPQASGGPAGAGSDAAARGSQRTTDQPPEPGGQSAPSTPGNGSSWLDALPPELRAAPAGECSHRTEAMLRQIYSTSRKRKLDFVQSLRSHRDYSNPDLLNQLVETYALHEHGTAFSPDVFDVAALPPEDRLDRLVTMLEREQERRKALRAAAPVGAATVAFERGTGALGTLPASGSAGNLHGAAVAAAAAAAAAFAARAAAAAHSGAGRSLVGTAALREQAAKSAEGMAARVKRSKWDAPR